MYKRQATYTSGFGAEISATISEYAFEHLDAPVTRLASIDTPIPFSPDTEKNIFWPKNQLKDKIIKLIEF